MVCFLILVLCIPINTRRGFDSNRSSCFVPNCRHCSLHSSFTIHNMNKWHYSVGHQYILSEETEKHRLSRPIFSSKDTFLFLCFRFKTRNNVSCLDFSSAMSKRHHLVIINHIKRHLARGTTIQRTGPALEGLNLHYNEHACGIVQCGQEY